LEALALRHAVSRTVPADLQRAREALAESDASTDLRVWEQANRKFHLALLAPCGMQRLLAAIDDLQAAASRILFAAWQTQNWQPRSEKEHQRILRAVEKGDGDDAAARLSAHILSAGEALVRSLEASRPQA
ncbi:FCD domain-containing protein, partial [Ramlibacter sp.]|uniref:GntR family transcriptional regulator n=1 Tax=Ramlibacter sp. TaxID=1917967 RepID=UPI0017E552D9